MIYEVLKSNGLASEKGRKGALPDGTAIFIAANEVPYAGYERVFEGNPDEMMDWLRSHKSYFPSLAGVDIGEKQLPNILPIRISMDSDSRPAIETKKSFNWKKWLAVAIAAAAAGAYLYA